MHASKSSGSTAPPPATRARRRPRNPRAAPWRAPATRLVTAPRAQRDLRPLALGGLAVSGGGAGAKRSSENERSVKQRICPVYALLSTHDLVHDVYASFVYGPDAIPFWKENFVFPGRLT